MVVHVVLQAASPQQGRLEEKILEGFRELGVDQMILPLLARDVEQLRRRADALAAQTLG